jgi:hypothetical protein
VKTRDAIDPVVLTRLATPNFFVSMRITPVRGRFFAENEGTPLGLRPVVVNEQLAKQLWPDGWIVIGKRLRRVATRSSATR